MNSVAAAQNARRYRIGACRCRTIVGAQKLAVLDGIVIERNDRAYGRSCSGTFAFGSSEPGTATGMPRFSARRTSCSI